MPQPLPLAITAHSACPLTADFAGEYGTEPVSQMLHRFAADLDPKVVEQVFDVQQQQRAFDVISTARPITLGEE